MYLLAASHLFDRSQVQSGLSMHREEQTVAAQKLHIPERGWKSLSQPNYPKMYAGDWATVEYHQGYPNDHRTPDCVGGDR